MKKIDQTRQWLTKNLSLLRCPKCGRAFVTVLDYSLACQQGHVWNLNKKGFVYFLDHAAPGEYDRENLADRRNVLQAGMFQPMIEQVAQYIPTEPQTILDIGTGEGTPLYQLMQARPDHHDTYLGFDISKAGVQLATQLDPNLFFCVADLRQLPFADASMSTIVEFFSPSDYQEFKRVLKPGGQVLKIIPNADYLIELRHLLYPTGEKRTYDNSAVVQRFAENYPTMQMVPIKYEFSLAPELRASLVQMSPLHWGKGARKLTATDLAQLTQVTIDVSLLIGRDN